MHSCENHEDKTSRHMMRRGTRMIAVCCGCWLASGGNPSPHHDCP